MDLALVVTLAAAAVVVVGLVATLVVTVAGRRGMAADLRASRQEVETLRSRLDALAESLEGPTGREDDTSRQQYVITSLPVGAQRNELVVAGQDASGRVVSGRHFAFVAATESVVRVVSLAHGVRRALTAENRNRIRFEMQREVKRARKQRRRDLKEAKRHLRTQPSGQPPVETEDAA